MSRNFGIHPRHEEPPRPDSPFDQAPSSTHFSGTVAGILVVFGAVIIHYAMVVYAWPRDNGRYANMDPKLHLWFDNLASGKGLCCSFADGVSIQDVDWDTQDGRYRVRLHGEWIFVPESAVVTEPNRFGPAVVWPYMDAEGATQIRCFLPGSMS